MLNYGTKFYPILTIIYVCRDCYWRLIGTITLNDLVVYDLSFNCLLLMCIEII